MREPGARPFRLLWGATMVSALGDGMYLAALPLLAATVTRDPALIAMVTVAAKLPWVLIGPFTGALTDRLDRIRLLHRVAFFQALVIGLFGLAVGAGAASLGLIVLVAFVLASSDTLSMNASSAAVPDLVDNKRLPTANSWLQGGQSMAGDLLGVAVGALLFGFAQWLPFALDSVSYALAALLLLRIRRPGNPPVRERITLGGLKRDVAEGGRWLARHRLLRMLCALTALDNFATVGVQSIAVLYALEVLGVGAGTYGLLMAVIAVGGAVGLLIAPMLCDRFGLGATLRLRFLLSPLPFLLTGLITHPLVAAGAFFFVGLSVILGNVASITLRQELVPRQLFGRVNASFRVVAVGIGPLGGGVAGWIAQVYGLRAPFFVGAATLLVTGLVALWALSPRALRFAEQPSACGAAGGGGSAR
ncbi:MFS transporter [Streptomyces sp. NPDC016172]|uniref:MFS transporter n=1 Tax=Streptomyces sp. NPDC016172 TaxID=3364964 RepID=UPI0036F87A8D